MRPPNARDYGAIRNAAIRVRDVARRGRRTAAASRGPAPATVPAFRYRADAFPLGRWSRGVGGSPVPAIVLLVVSAVILRYRRPGRG